MAEGAASWVRYTSNLVHELCSSTVLWRPRMKQELCFVEGNSGRVGERASRCPAHCLRQVTVHCNCACPKTRSPFLQLAKPHLGQWQDVALHKDAPGCSGGGDLGVFGHCHTA